MVDHREERSQLLSTRTQRGGAVLYANQHVVLGSMGARSTKRIGGGIKGGCVIGGSRKRIHYDAGAAHTCAEGEHFGQPGKVVEPHHTIVYGTLKERRHYAAQQKLAFLQLLLNLRLVYVGHAVVRTTYGTQLHALQAPQLRVMQRAVQVGCNGVGEPDGNHERAA